MLEITEQEIQDRLAFDNPWWEPGEGIQKIYAEYPRRLYFKPFCQLVTDSSVNRAVILLGPRRVGKTVMVYHTIQSLLDQGVLGNAILYLSLETPLYTGIALEKITLMFRNRFSHSRDTRLFIFFDEIQYLKEWEIHLKSLVDSYPLIQFIATGSAAAALKVKSRESGAGRFSDFQLPPLSFAEFLDFTKQEESLITSSDESENSEWEAEDIEGLNRAFIDYLNFGGYPEAVFIDKVRQESTRYIKSDIIDKVLLRDLPSLYGITDIQELNRLFTVLAYNTGNEVSYEKLTKSSGVAKNTVKKYLEYLEAAFLIRRLYPLDRNARRFQRISRFKVYLTNPSMRAALFGPVEAESDAMGFMNETAIISQWQHDTYLAHIYYARWTEGEVDLVGMDSVMSVPRWCMEIKWSDRVFHNPRELKSLISFAEGKGISDIRVTTRSLVGTQTIGDILINFLPSSLYCYSLGRNLLSLLNSNNTADQ